MNKKRLVCFTGAGISQESGLKTFRDCDSPIAREFTPILEKATIGTEILLKNYL